MTVTVKRPIGEFSRGWRVLTAAFVGVGVSLVSLLYYSGGVFIRPIEEEFGWSRAQLGVASLISVITLSLCAPVAGRLIDLYGLRRVSVISLLLYACGVFALSLMQANIYLYYALVAAYTVAGAASSPVAFTRAVVAYFDHNRGLALGLALTSTGVAAVVLPATLTPFVAEHGWRSGFVLLACVIVAATPIIFAWINDTPPSATTAPQRSATPHAMQASGVTLGAAAKRSEFWLLALTFFLVALAVGGLIVSFIPLLQDGGLGAAEAGGYGALLGASVILGRLVTGFLIDRFHAPLVAAVVFGLAAAGLLVLGLGGLGLAFAGAIALGFAMGAEVDLIGFFTARYFGLSNYSQIYGVLYSCFLMGSGISPILAGLVYDVFGDYQLALFGAAAILLLASGLTLLLGSRPSPIAAMEP